MKHSGKPKKINKGGPSGLIISLAIHAGAFFLAGLFVVFTVVNKPEPEFEPPPPIERPKMKLKKPKVKVKKSSQPKPSSRIVAKVKTREMPEIQLPDLMGSGEGLMGGTGLGGEFLELPPIKEVTLMGSTESVGSDLIGTYYDLKMRKDGSPAGFVNRNDYFGVVRDFITQGWDVRILEKYYKLPRRMYLTTLVVPVIPTSFAPVAFGDTEATEGGYWLVHYKGKLVHKEGITFRFWAGGDVLLVVRVDGKVVVASVWDTYSKARDSQLLVVGSAWTSSSAKDRQYIFGRDALAGVGDWITLEPGVPKDMEILVGDEDGMACAYLAVEEEGVEYETSIQGGPILPAFKTAELSHDMLDVIYAFLPEDDMICLTNGPVFSDY